jgi:hypothetical protein
VNLAQSRDLAFLIDDGEFAESRQYHLLDGWPKF